MTANFTRLRITGFKSFAEPVSVEILPGLTGIVGPNGCGKSNVVEALRWVMGESSARSMRGGEMDDVIFAGTTSRASRNVAEVVLTLEGAAGLAPAPFEASAELQVMRRIERGEGSSYRVNGRELRARDVQTLFADLASGARSSAMVSQGRVASLINARPEERRQVLEEAAGITGLHARRHEAELKLRAAETNLERAEDGRLQLEQQLEGLKRQARQAGRYRALSGLVREAEAEWLGLLLMRAAFALDEARTAAVLARRQLREAEAAAERAVRAAFEAEQGLPGPREAEATARSALERRRVENEGIERVEAAARAALAQAVRLADELAEDVRHAAAVLDEARGREAQLGAEAAGLEAGLPARLRSATDDAADAAGAEAAAVAQAAAARLALEAAREAHAAGLAMLAVAREQAAAAEAAAARARLACDEAEQRVARAGEQQARLDAEQAAALAAQLDPALLLAAEAAVEAASAEMAALTAALEAAEAAAVAASAAAAAARRASEDGAATRRRLSSEVVAAAAAVERLEAELAAVTCGQEAAAEQAVPAAALAAAATALAEAQSAAGQAGPALAAAVEARRQAEAAHASARRDAAEAAAEAAAIRREAATLTALLAASRRDGAAPVLEAISVPAGLEAALAAGLGAGLESPVDAPDGRHWRSEIGPMAGPLLPEKTVSLDALVSAPAALGRALSWIGLLEDGVDGRALQAGLAPGQTLVRRDGAAWRWDGHVLPAGEAGAEAERLRQRNRLAALEQSAATAERALASAEAALAQAAGGEADAVGAADAAAADERNAAAALTAAAAAVDRLQALAAEATRRETALAAERARVDEALRQALPVLDAARRALAAVPAERLGEQLAAAEAAAEALSGRVASLRNDRRTAELAQAQARDAASALARRAAEASSRLDGLGPQRAFVGQETAAAAAALLAATTAREALPALAVTLAACEAAGRAEQAARDDAAAALLALQAAEQRARQAADEAAALSRAALDAAQDQARLETARRELADWAGRTAQAAARLALVAARHEVAERARDDIADEPAAAARRHALSAGLLEAAEAAHLQAAAGLRAAETGARTAETARRDGEAALAAAREAVLRGEAAESQAEAALAGVQERAAERLGAVPARPAGQLPSAMPGEEAVGKALRKFERLTRERDEMGPVNLRAELEAEALEARSAAITTERGELTGAIASLRGSIGHLNREGRERLSAMFGKVDREFQTLFGRMFSGGRAHLSLVGSDDVLAAGLEIYVQPPGKKLATLSLLSGGEQALTALSLIFAMFRCNPAPVCVLDEVDAPLDDANVDRFCGLLEEMVRDTGTRFLVVTHHQLTMARMDRLYGVTMQERGVSRLLSVDLVRAAAMVEARQAAE